MNEGCAPGAEWLGLWGILPERKFCPQGDLGIGKIQCLQDRNIESDFSG
jgi:hypothetical protein